MLKYLPEMKTVRKWFRIIHRDFGYFFFGVTIIYALSGIALNHRKDWDPNFVIDRINIATKEDLTKSLMTKQKAKSLIAAIDENVKYKKFYYPNETELKIFITDGTVYFDTETGKGYLETIRKRAIFNEVNYLHYNPINWWTWFSDIYAGALILLAITGLFLIRGANGITGRGAWLTFTGIAIPIIFLLILR